MTAATFGARPIRVHRTRVSDVAASPRTSSVDPARQIEGRYGVVPCPASQSTAFSPLGHRGWRKMAVLTLPVERKYCARAITNSWAGTSFTVRGADGMVRARQKKGLRAFGADPKKERLSQPNGEKNLSRSVDRNTDEVDP
jgi:hypothetical protein